MKDKYLIDKNKQPIVMPSKEQLDMNDELSKEFRAIVTTILKEK